MPSGHPGRETRARHDVPWLPSVLRLSARQCSPVFRAYLNAISVRIDSSGGTK